MDKSHSDQVKSELLVPLLVVNIVQYLLIGLGGLVLLCTAAFHVRLYVRKVSLVPLCTTAFHVKLYVRKVSLVLLCTLPSKAKGQYLHFDRFFFL